jgi:succinate dehydrogenase (ubiquinone) cytochrome b560 subunit
MGAEQSKKKAKQMKDLVTDNPQLSNQQLRNLFDNIKRETNKSIKNEEKKEFVNTMLDSLCNDLIRRGNLIIKRKNILRPLSPHLPIYKPQLTSTFPISHRISGAFLATIVLFFYLLCLKIGLICFTYEIFYQFFFFSSKLILIYVEITALALSYHLFNGLRHLFTDFSGFFFLRIGRKRLK